MSKETRARDRLRTELRQRVTSLEAKVKTAANTLAREHFGKQPIELRNQLQQLN